MPEMRGCDLVVEYLVREKVPYLFGYAGHGAVGLLDGVYDRQDEIKIVFPRIESGAGYMADAYFRATGKVIPVYTSTGPGPMLLTVAMGNAFYDSSAFVAITGQVATSQYDSGALQEEYRHYQADYPSMARVVTKRSFQAQSVADLGKFLPKAFKLARTGRPGPVHIDVPYDLWPTKADVEVPEPEERSEMLSWRTPGSPEAVERAVDLLLKARRPLILAGGGVICSDASAELASFAEHANIPVYTSFMGKGALSARHPLHLGIAGCWGEYPAQEAARNADVIMAFGCPLLRHPLLVVAPRLHVQHPAHEAHPRGSRPAGDRAQLPDRDRHRRRRPRGPEAVPRDRDAQGPEAGALAVERPGGGVQGRVDELHRAGEGVRRSPDRAAAGHRRAQGGGAGRHADDHRHGQPPDLGRAVLGRLRAPFRLHAGWLRRHGLRHVRGARHEARAARPARGLRHERRLAG